MKKSFLILVCIFLIITFPFPAHAFMVGMSGRDITLMFFAALAPYLLFFSLIFSFFYATISTARLKRREKTVEDKYFVKKFSKVFAVTILIFISIFGLLFLIG